MSIFFDFFLTGKTSFLMSRFSRPSGNPVYSSWEQDLRSASVWRRHSFSLQDDIRWLPGLNCLPQILFLFWPLGTSSPKQSDCRESGLEHFTSTLFGAGSSSDGPSRCTLVDTVLLYEDSAPRCLGPELLDEHLFSRLVPRDPRGRNPIVEFKFLPAICSC